MANRRDSDSQQSTRNTLPPAALTDVKPGKVAAAAPAKQTGKQLAPEPVALAVNPPVDAAVDAALEAALAAPTSPTPAKSRKRRATPSKPQAVIAASKAPKVSEDERRGMIALAAYVRAERRGFSPGGEAEDWLLAEQEVDALLNSRHPSAQ